MVNFDLDVLEMLANEQIMAEESSDSSSESSSSESSSDDSDNEIAKNLAIQLNLNSSNTEKKKLIEIL